MTQAILPSAPLWHEMPDPTSANGTGMVPGEEKSASDGASEATGMVMDSGCGKGAQNKIRVIVMAGGQGQGQGQSSSIGKALIVNTNGTWAEFLEVRRAVLGGRAPIAAHPLYFLPKALPQRREEGKLVPPAPHSPMLPPRYPRLGVACSPRRHWRPLVSPKAPPRDSLCPLSLSLSPPFSNLP